MLLSAQVTAQQLSSQYIELCDDFFRDTAVKKSISKYPEKIVCGNSISATFWDNMLSHVEYSDWRTFYEYQLTDTSKDPSKRIYNKVDSIDFSLDEIKNITASLENKENIKWEDNNALDSLVFINTDSLRKIDSLSAPPNVNEKTFYAHFPHNTLYNISKPIFLRDNTVCILYHGYSSLYFSCGELTIYVKEKKGWKALTALYSIIT